MNEPINKIETPEFAIINLDDYQLQATQHAIYPGQDTFIGLVYTALKMNGEAGELAEKVGKIMRDDGGFTSQEKKDAMILELGDVLWYISAAANELGVTLADVADRNLRKLASRSDRGKLSGSGDNR